MKSYARIDNDVVKEIIETEDDIATLFHPSLEFMDCTNIAGVEVGWIKENGGLIAPPGPDLNTLKSAKTNEIAAAFIGALAEGFVTTSGIKMDADITDVQLLKSAYDLMILVNQTTLPILVDYNNTAHVDMPLTEVIAIIIEVAVNYQTLYAKKQALRGQAMAADNEAELDLIAW